MSTTTTNVSYELQLTSGQLHFLTNRNQAISRTACLVSLIERASLQDTEYQKKGYETMLGVGMLAMSEVELAELWNCNRKSVSKLLDMFHEHGLLSSVQGNRTSVHTIHCVSRWLVDGRVICNPHVQMPDEFKDSDCQYQEHPCHHPNVIGCGTS